jgi:hypothetical protein
LNADITPLDFPHSHGDEIKKEGQVALCFDGDHLVCHELAVFLENILQVRRLAASSRAIVYDFTFNLPFF